MFGGEAKLLIIFKFFRQQDLPAFSAPLEEEPFRDGPGGRPVDFDAIDEIEKRKQVCLAAEVVQTELESSLAEFPAGGQVFNGGRRVLEDLKADLVGREEAKAMKEC